MKKVVRGKVMVGSQVRGATEGLRSASNCKCYVSRPF